MIGKQLAHYRIVSRLGSGGMAEVFLAEDTRLGREVALKILPEDLARHPERLERFEREARSLASLNHPNVVTIHSVEEADGMRVLVMERVLGNPLNTMIPPGGLTLDRTLDLAIPIADALVAAHERGVIHRDLKPSNVMVTPDGRVKVIDFGLAKLFGVGGVEMSSDAPTEVLTVEGRILGTPGYMAPEQVEGGAIDARTDLFALGIILFELSTGQRPFTGTSHAAILSSILRDSPLMVTDLKPELPHELARIIRHCLEKDPRARFQTALDVRNELRSLRTDWQSGSITPSASQVAIQRPASPGSLPGAAKPASSRRRAKAGAAVLLLLSLAFAWAWWGRPPSGTVGPTAGGSTPTQKLSAPRELPILGRLSPRPISAGQSVAEWPAWSPDGRRLLYAASDGQFQQLFIMEIGSGATPVQVTSGSYDHFQPAWSPTREEILYVRSSKEGDRLDPSDVVFGVFVGGNVVRRDLKSGEETVVVQDAFYPVFTPDGDWLICSVESPGEPARLRKMDRQGNRRSQLSQDSSDLFFHVEPCLDREGKRLVYRRTDTRNANQIVILDLETRATTAVTSEGWNFTPAWDDTGRHLYFASYGGAAVNLFRIGIGSGNKPVGKPEQVTAGAGYDVHPAVSPDGNRLAYCIRHPNSDLWRIPIDPATGRRTGDLVHLPVPVNTQREDSRPAWSPDAAAIAFNSDRDGPMNLYVHRFEATNQVQRVTTGGGGDFQPNWSPDGKRLAFFSSRTGSSDIWLVETNGQGLVNLTPDSPAEDINPFFSPDGRHIAFMSDRTGAVGLFVMDPDGRNVKQLTTEPTGGHYSPWYSATEVLTGSSHNGVRGYFLFSTAGAAPRLLFPQKTVFGAHGSFSPGSRWLMDLGDHRHLYVATPFEMSWENIYDERAPQTRIDYPVWSPKGDAALIARSRVEGAELWLLEGLRAK